MIPDFPEFKKLELLDKQQIESYTGHFLPYSDFNFISMFSWDIRGDMRVSILNSNLVVRFNDYITGKPFYSFLGNNKVNETVEEIIEYSKLFGGDGELKLVPEASVKDIDHVKYLVTEEQDQFDYVFDLNILAKMEGGHFASKRTAINKLKRNFPTMNFCALDILNIDIKQKIEKVNEQWSEQKIKNDPYFDLKNELSAIKNFLNMGVTENIATTGVFIDNRLVCYSIFEKLSNSYLLSHFLKADIEYQGIYDFLMQENSKFFISSGIQYLNFEQDLGIQGLKTSKKNFSTGIFLKKYKIVLK